MLRNTEKTKINNITTQQKRLHIDDSILSLSYIDVDLEMITRDRILGINIDANLTWSDHLYFVCEKSIHLCLVVI